MATKVLGVLALVLMIAALYAIFIYAPYADALQGPIYRMIFFHVPQAMLCYLSAILLGFASVMFLVKNDFKWDRFGVCAAELGLLFTTTTILSGMLWGKPVWGT